MKTLYIVYSLAKTGTTTFFELLRSQGACVARTHGCTQFRVYNFDGILHSEIGQNVVSPEVFERDVVSQFDTIKMLGMLRHPVTRRISQYLHSLSSVSFVSMLMLDKPPTICPMFKQAMQYFLTHNEKYTVDQAIDEFKRVFNCPNPYEYTRYFEHVQSMVGSSLDFDVLQSSYWKSTGTYAGKPMTIVLFKLENLGALKPDILEFLDIKTDVPIVHRLDKASTSHLVAGDIHQVSRALMESVAGWEPYVELMNHDIVKHMGYTSS